MMKKFLKGIVLIKGLPILLRKGFKLVGCLVALVAGYRLSKRYNLTDHLPMPGQLRQLLNRK